MHFVHPSVIVGLSQLRHYPVKCMRRSESGSVRQMPTVPQPFFWRASLAASSADRKSTRLNSSHLVISYAVFCLKKKKNEALERYSDNADSCVSSSKTDAAQFVPGS